MRSVWYLPIWHTIHRVWRTYGDKWAVYRFVSYFLFFYMKQKNFIRVCWKLHTFHKINVIYSIVNIATQVNFVWWRWLANLSFLFCVYGGNGDWLYKQMTLIRFELFWRENEMNELTNANEMITIAIARVYLLLTEAKMLRSSVQFGPEISICISLF